jgi:uncharacterized protein
MVQDEQDILESLHVLLSTRRGERFLRPEFGSSLHRQVFEVLDNECRDRICQMVREAIRLHERRVETLALAVRPDPDDDALAHVEIRYRILATGEVAETDLEFSLGAVLG